MDSCPGRVGPQLIRPRPRRGEAVGALGARSGNELPPSPAPAYRSPRLGLAPGVYAWGVWAERGKHGHGCGEMCISTQVCVCLCACWGHVYMGGNPGTCGG